MIPKNLNQLKKLLVAGVEFEILLHARKECIGQHRRVTKVNTSGIYSVDPDSPDGAVSAGNDGLGWFFEWGPARTWTFDAEGVCAKYTDHKDGRPNEILIAFKILDTKPCDTCAHAGWEKSSKVAACNCCENYNYYRPKKEGTK